MKKIFTLALALSIFSASFAQRFVAQVSYSRPVISISVGRHFSEAYSFTNYEKNMQIDRINQNYNMQVNSVMKMRLGASKKIKLIKELQVERNNKIQNVNDRFYDSRNKYNDRDYDRNYNWMH